MQLSHVCTVKGSLGMLGWYIGPWDIERLTDWLTG